MEIPKGCDVHHEGVSFKKRFAVSIRRLWLGAHPVTLSLNIIVELGVVIGKDARDVPVSEAFDYIAGK